MLRATPIDSSLQAVYRETQRDRLRPRLRLALVAAIALVPIFIPWVRYVDPEQADRALPVQLGLLGVLLLVLILTYRALPMAHLSLTALAAGTIAYGGVAMVLVVIEDGFLYGSALLVLAMLVSTTLLSDVELRYRLSFAALSLLIPNLLLVVTDAPTFTIVNTNWVLLPGIFMALVLSYQVDHTNRRAFLLERALAEERRRSDTLLKSILPPVIAERLKQTEARIADVVDEATILFADLAGFTPLVSQLTPDDLIDMLDRLFARLDDLATRYGVEKIKTIGDAYMVATGVADATSRDAADVAAFSLAAVDMVERFAGERGLPLRLRIGIATGPVVSGVIGKSKPQFDLWGETVNRASRIQSTGLAGEVQADERTAELLRKHYTIEPRGVIELRGIGPMQLWLVKRPRAAAPRGAARTVEQGS